MQAQKKPAGSGRADVRGASEAGATTESTTIQRSQSTDYRRELDRLRARAIRSERLVISTVLQYGRREYLQEDFAPRYPRHVAIASAIRSLGDSARCDLLTVHDELARTGRLDAAGGVVYLAETTSKAEPLPPSRMMLEELALEVAAMWSRYDAALAALRSAEGVLAYE